MMNKKFRLPRKEKKRLKKMRVLTYPLDNHGYLMANPATNEKDYLAYKRGELINLFDFKKNKRKNKFDDLDEEIYIDDETLKDYVNKIFAYGYKGGSFNLLMQAKNHDKAKIAYFNFINAYHKCEDGDDSYSTICCLSVDLARKLLK